MGQAIRFCCAPPPAGRKDRASVRVPDLTKADAGQIRGGIGLAPEIGGSFLECPQQNSASILGSRLVSLILENHKYLVLMCERVHGQWGSHRRGSAAMHPRAAWLSGSEGAHHKRNGIGVAESLKMSEAERSLGSKVRFQPAASLSRAGP